MANLGYVSSFNINGNELSLKDAALTEIVEEIIEAIGANNGDISERINNLHDRSFDALIKISSNDDSEIASIQDGIYKLHYVTVTGEGEQQAETLNNSAILIQQGTHQYLYKDGKLSNREKTNNTWSNWITFEGGVTSVNGQTGAVTLSIPTKTSDITNDSGFITDAGVTSFNGQTGAVTYTAPVTSVDGKTGTVTIEHPVTSVNGQTGAVTIDTGVTSFNGQTGAVTYTAPITSVNGQTGAVTIDLTGKADKSAAIGSLQLSINSTDYKVTLSGTKVDGTAFTCEDVIDLPLETMVVSGAYDDTTQKIVLTLKNGTTTDFPVSALIDGLQSEITSTNKLSADLISDGNTNKVVTQAEKDTWNNKVTSVNGQTGVVTIDTGVTSFNGQTGVVTYTAPVTSVNGQTGVVTIDTGVTSFNGQTDAVTYTAPVTSVNGQTGAVVTELSSEYAPSTAVNDELELAAGDTYEEAFGKIEKALNDHATITATALNTLAQNSQLNTIESISVNGVPVSIDSSKNVDITISNDNDKVIAEALIDLNDRLEVVEGISVGDENIIETVKVNGTALVPDANKAVDISVPNTPEQIGAIPDYSKQYLTFESLSDNTHLYFRSTRGGESCTISASSDNGKTWNEYTSSNSANNNNGTLIATLMKGQKVMIKGNIISLFTGRGYSRFNGLEGDGSLILYGNIMSLAFGDDFIGKTSMKKTVQEPTYEYDETTGQDVIVGYEDVEENICFGWVFETILNLVSAENLILPAVDMFDGYNGAYEGMFHNCISLVKAPSILPATTLASNCYWKMFEDCFSLQNAPELPATTLASGCYQYMFYGCESLTTAPELPATTLANSCYGFMFEGCSSLTTAPELPATTLATSCYSAMFQGCTRLNYIKAMFTTTPSKTYTNNWVSGVASAGTFVKNSDATWDVTGANGVPTGWTIYTEDEYTVVRHYELANITSGVSSVNGQTGDVTLSIPTKTSDITNDSGFITDAGVISFNGQTGAITYTAPVTSVNGQTGAVTIDTGVTSFNGQTGAVTYTAPVTSVNGQTGAVTIDTGVTSFNGSTGAINYSAPVTSVNGQTGIVNLSIPTKTSDITNDSGFITDAGVTSFNGQTGAVTYTAPVTSVNGQTGEVNLTIPDAVTENTVSGWGFTKNTGTYSKPSTGIPASDLADGVIPDVPVQSVNGQTGAVTINVGVTSFNGQTGAITYTAPVTSVNGATGAVNINVGVTSFNGQTGAITYTAPVTSVNGATGAVNINVGVTSFNGQTGAITYTAPVTSVNGATGAVTVKANVQSDWNAITGDAVILNKPTIPTVNDSTVTIKMNGNTVGTFTLNKSGNTTIDLGNVLTSHQSIKTINNQTITGTGNISLNTLPTVSASDNGKVLMVVNGAWQLVSPVTLYSGSGTPANSQGNNGDLYVQS